MAWKKQSNRHVITRYGAFTSFYPLPSYGSFNVIIPSTIEKYISALSSTSLLNSAGTISMLASKIKSVDNVYSIGAYLLSMDYDKLLKYIMILNDEYDEDILPDKKDYDTLMETIYKMPDEIKINLLNDLLFIGNTKSKIIPFIYLKYLEIMKNKGLNGENSIFKEELTKILNHAYSNYLILYTNEPKVNKKLHEMFSDNNEFSNIYNNIYKYSIPAIASLIAISGDTKYSRPFEKMNQEYMHIKNKFTQYLIEINNAQHVDVYGIKNEKFDDFLSYDDLRLELLHDLKFAIDLAHTNPELFPILYGMMLTYENVFNKVGYSRIMVGSDADFIDIIDTLAISHGNNMEQYYENIMKGISYMARFITKRYVFINPEFMDISDTEVIMTDIIAIMLSDLYLLTENKIFIDKEKIRKYFKSNYAEITNKIKKTLSEIEGQ